MELGCYSIIEKIGSGVFARVWKAELNSKRVDYMGQCIKFGHNKPMGTSSATALLSPPSASATTSATTTPLSPSAQISSPEKELPKKIYAIKVQKKGTDNDQSAKDEVLILLKINKSTENMKDIPISRMIDYFYAKVDGIPRCSLVFEYYGANMFTVVKRIYQKFEADYKEVKPENIYKRRLPINVVKKVIKQLIEALSIIHPLGIIHTDVKLDNILLTKPFNELDLVNFPLSDYDIKLADFGNACWVGNEFSDYVQSMEYRAPECILGHKYDTTIDIWACGCATFELLTGYPLFSLDEEPIENNFPDSSDSDDPDSSESDDFATKPAVSGSFENDISPFKIDSGASKDPAKDADEIFDDLDTPDYQPSKAEGDAIKAEIEPEKAKVDIKDESDANKSKSVVDEADEEAEEEAGEVDEEVEAGEGDDSEAGEADGEEADEEGEDDDDEESDLLNFVHLFKMVAMLGDIPRKHFTEKDKFDQFFNEVGMLNFIHPDNIAKRDIETILIDDHMFSATKAKEIKQFLRQMIEWIPEQRKSAEEILKSKWLSQSGQVDSQLTTSTTTAPAPAKKNIPGPIKGGKKGPAPKKAKK